MKRIFTWTTAILSTVIIGVTAGATTVFIVANPTKVIDNLAPAVMAGVGTTLGAALGGLIALRFKVVRSFIHNVIYKQD